MTKANEHYYWDNLPRRKAYAILFDRAIFGKTVSLVHYGVNKRMYVAAFSDDINDSFRFLFGIKSPSQCRGQAPHPIIGGKTLYWRLRNIDPTDVADFMADKQCFIRRPRETAS